MWSDRLITACITCSISSTVTPRSRICRMMAMISRISDGLSPAITSSSSSSRGEVASARASSSRLRPATVSSDAGCASMCDMPTCSAMACAWAQACARLLNFW